MFNFFLDFAVLKKEIFLSLSFLRKFFPPGPVFCFASSLPFFRFFTILYTFSGSFEDHFLGLCQSSPVFASTAVPF